jgi:hypothetical protein
MGFRIRLAPPGRSRDRGVHLVKSAVQVGNVVRRHVDPCGKCRLLRSGSRLRDCVLNYDELIDVTAALGVYPDNAPLKSL